MRLADVENLNHEDEFVFAVAVGLENNLMHCALLYKWEDDRIRTIEFFGNRSIRHSRTIGDLGHKDYVYSFYNRDLIIDPIAAQVPAICELIRENNESIGFGIKFSETKFDTHGNLVSGNNDFGLTCATFVIAVLQRASIYSIDTENWQPREQDVEWQKKVLEHLVEANSENPISCPDVVVDHFRNNIGFFRYRPEEVAASTASPEMPATFDFCQEYGHRICESIEMGIEFYETTYLG